MNTTFCYGDWQATKVTLLAEVHDHDDLLECSDNALSVVVLPSDARDIVNFSDEEELPENHETAHEHDGLLVAGNTGGTV